MRPNRNSCSVETQARSWTSSIKAGGRKAQNVQAGDGDGWVCASSDKEHMTLIADGKPALVTHLMLRNYASKRFAVQYRRNRMKMLLTWRTRATARRSVVCPATRQHAWM